MNGCVYLTLAVPRVGYKDVFLEGLQAVRREGRGEEGGRVRGKGSIIEQYHDPTLAVLTDLEAILSCLDVACPFLLTVYIHAKWRDSTEVSTVDKKLKNNNSAGNKCKKS